MRRRSGLTQDAGATMDAVQPPGPEDVVTIKLPAAGAYLSVLRTATAGLAARLDFTLDEIEDLRIAVDEACAMLLTQALPGADLECRFALESDSMRVGVSVLTLDGQEPSRDTFAWTVLAALAGEVDSSAGVDNRVTITLLKRRSGSSR
jgi:serine/threonine-protein kinase RsbW